VGTRARWLVTAAAALAVLAPAAWPHASDGFPISSYPMFTSERDRTIGLDTVVLEHDGRRTRLSPQAIGGTDEVVLASTTVSNAIAAGPGAVARLCREVARRVDRPGTVEVVTEVYDTIDLLRHGAEATDRTVHGTCEASP
jgi:hypothetical protein